MMVRSQFGRFIFTFLIVLSLLLPLGAEEGNQPPAEGGGGGVQPPLKVTDENVFRGQDHSTTITILNPLDGLGQSSTEGGLVEAIALSDGSFGVVMNPSFSLGPFSARLALTLKGKLTMDPLNFNLDFTDWIAPERQEEEDVWQYSLSVARHYSRFIQAFQFGNPFDPVFIRYGKLLGSTLGDGALISGYVDRSVGLLTAKPGLTVMIDGSPVTGVSSGFHFLVDDLIEPKMSAWRIYSAPFEKEAYLPALQLGLSYATGTRSVEERAITRHFFGLDFSYPLLDKKIIKTDLFTDLLLQGLDSSAPELGIGIRSGINGRLGKLITYNFSFTAPIFGKYYASFFTNEWALEHEQQLILPLGSNRLEGSIAFAWPKQEIYFGAKMAGDVTAAVVENQRMFANLRFDHLLFNVLSLDLRYEKLYSNEKDESFLKGLMTLNNVDIQALAIIKFKPYVISLGVTLAYDEEAHLTSTIDAIVRIVLL